MNKNLESCCLLAFSVIFTKQGEVGKLRFIVTCHKSHRNKMIKYLLIIIIKDLQKPAFNRMFSINYANCYQKTRLKTGTPNV